MINRREFAAALIERYYEETDFIKAAGFYRLASLVLKSEEEEIVSYYNN